MTDVAVEQLQPVAEGVFPEQPGVFPEQPALVATELPRRLELALLALLIVIELGWLVSVAFVLYLVL